VDLLQQAYTVAKLFVTTAKACCKKGYRNILLQRAKTVADL